MTLADAMHGRLIRPQLALTVGLSALGVVLLTGLGIWQIERLGWKLRLIDAVNSRVHAAAIAAPGPGAWPALTADADEYRHVAATGRYKPDADVLVQAVTERGPGFWVMTPLETDRGFDLLVNRGFVPEDRRSDAASFAPPKGEISFSGLLRMSEPGGGFLRANDPAHQRWYSRDVAAIAVADGLSSAAPYFVDAEATPNAGGLPVGGLTVIDLPNSHLIYALTWFALAAMLAGGTIFALRTEWRSGTPLER